MQLEHVSNSIEEVWAKPGWESNLVVFEVDYLVLIVEYPTRNASLGYATPYKVTRNAA